MAEDPGGGPPLTGPWVGVDGCRSGWQCAWLAADGWNLRRIPTFDEVLVAFPEEAVLAVDMPIGLPDEGFRECDLLARALLGRFASRVFLAPPRPCLGARTPTEFQAIHRRLTGKGAGVPVWRIVPQILELDRLLGPELHGRVFEAHPELAFQALAGTPLPSKHTPEGLAARRRVLGLAPHERPTTDDDLDAMVLSLVARLFVQGRTRTLPALPRTDALGKPMRIVVPIAP